MRYHYPRRKRYKFDRKPNELRITLHGEGFVTPADYVRDLVDKLLSFTGHDLLDIALTPSPNSAQVVLSLSKTPLIRYEGLPGPDNEHLFGAILQTGREDRRSLARSPFDSNVVERIWGYPKGTSV